MKLYKLTVEYAIVVAAEDGEEACSVEDNAVHYMMQGADDILSHPPDNALAEEIKSENDLPSQWIADALPFTSAGLDHDESNLTIRQILELSNRDPKSLTYTVVVSAEPSVPVHNREGFKSFKQALKHLKQVAAELESDAVFQIMKVFPDGQTTAALHLTTGEISYGNV
jgi:hypothetical protein